MTHDTGREPLPCPRCRTDLDATVIDKSLIDLCANCGGVWLDHSAFESLIRERKFADVTTTLNIPGWATQQTYQQVEKDQLYVRCPICEQFMHRRNFAKRSGIILDVCAAHGIWFDANELARVFNYRITDDPVKAASMRYKNEGTQTSSSNTVIIHQSGHSPVTGAGGLAELIGLIAGLFN
ncbi:MAG: zf-TFIIB domain-containing protein [Gammaproteobacteria bacterium]|nr:zf-TFIIB domain-containing protein [Gammaproteobacteria bacterium]MDH3767764.1 zf-TFIIB domain-containing protein [Gammaproteobacteria bacterium]